MQKPKLTVRPNEGAKSLFKRGKSKALPKDLIELKALEDAVDIQDMRLVLALLDRFFELVYTTK